MITKYFKVKCQWSWIQYALELCGSSQQARTSYLVGFRSRVDKLLHSSLNKHSLLDVLPEKKAGWGRVQEVIDLFIVNLNKWTFTKETLGLRRLLEKKKKRIRKFHYEKLTITGLQDFHINKMSKLTLSTSLLMRKNRYSKLRGITPRSSSVKLSTSDGPSERENTTTHNYNDSITPQERVVNLSHKSYSHQAWWMFSLSLFVHCRSKRGDG